MSASDLFRASSTENWTIDEIKKFDHLRAIFTTADRDNNYLLNQLEFKEFIQLLYSKHFTNQQYNGLYENWCKHFKCDILIGIDFLSLKQLCIQQLPIKSWSPTFYPNVPSNYICKACDQHNDHWIMCCKMLSQFQYKKKQKKQKKHTCTSNELFNKYYTEDQLIYLTVAYIRDLSKKWLFLHKLGDTLIREIIYRYHPRIDRFTIVGGAYVNPINRLEISSAKYTTSLFGGWLSGNGITCINKIKFNMKTAHPEYSGIGFITDKFEEFVRWEWNEGYNNSMVVHGNGYFITSECFDPEMKNYQKHIFGKGNNLYETGHDVIVKIDTKKMIAIIWNYTVLKLDDINEMYLNDISDKHRQYVFVTKLPLDKEKIGITVEMGGWTEQTVVVTEQSFIFNR
eukprot:164875_1